MVSFFLNYPRKCTLAALSLLLFQATGCLVGYETRRKTPKCGIDGAEEDVAQVTGKGDGRDGGSLCWGVLKF